MALFTLTELGVRQTIAKEVTTAMVEDSILINLSVLVQMLLSRLKMRLAT